MTLKDTFLTKSEISRLAGWLIAGPDMDMDIELPPPCILKVNVKEYYKMHIIFYKINFVLFIIFILR